MAGAAVVPLNPLLKEDEVRYVLEDSGATALVCLQASLPVLRAARRGLPRRVPIVVLDAPADGEPGDHTLLGAPAESQRADVSALGSEDVAVCLYTSGTTGRPKGALLSHRNLIANLESFRAVLRVTEEDVFLAVLPLFHAYGATVLFLEPLSLGATIVVEPRFVPEAVLRAIAQHRVSSLRRCAQYVCGAGGDPATGRRLLGLAAVHLGRSAAAALGRGGVRDAVRDSDLRRVRPDRMRPRLDGESALRDAEGRVGGPPHPPGGAAGRGRPGRGGPGRRRWARSWRADPT